MKATLAVSLVAMLCAAGAGAEEKPIALKDAPGHAAVEQNCASCHTLDYPRTNSPFLSRQGWEAEVNKMINIFGAPITPDDAKTIVDYLVKNYGVGG